MTRKCIEGSVAKPEGKGSPGSPGSIKVDDIKKMTQVWTGMISLRIGTYGGYCEQGNELLNSI
jgi:hypothetical protein